MFGFEKLIAKIYAEWQNNARLNKVPSKFSPSLGERDGKFISTWNFGYILNSWIKPDWSPHGHLRGIKTNYPEANFMRQTGKEMVP